MGTDLLLPGHRTWNNERCYAYRVLGQCYEEKGMQWEAEGAYHKACAEAPNTREPWCALSLLKYRQSQWPECYAAAMRALSILSDMLPLASKISPAESGTSSLEKCSIFCEVLSSNTRKCSFSRPVTKRL